jgi:drug/metabolite transporter (DMT)-like permease
MKRSTTWVLMALHVVFAAVNYVLAKGATQHFASMGALTMTRAAFSAVLLLVLAYTVIPRPSFTPREWLRVAILGVLLVPLNQYLFLVGLRDTAPGHAALLYAMTPLGVLLLQSALHRRAPPLTKWVAVLVALAGVFLILRPWATDDPHFREIRTGDAWIAVGAVIWVVSTVATVPLVRRHDPRTVTAWSLILGALMLLPITAGDVASTDFAALPAAAWWGLASLVVLASVVMMLLWNALLRHLHPVEVSVCTNAQPIVTAALTASLSALGWPVADADFGAWFWAGTALVVTGVAMAQRQTKPYAGAGRPDAQPAPDAQ